MLVLKGITDETINFNPKTKMYSHPVPLLYSKRKDSKREYKHVEHILFGVAVSISIHLKIFTPNHCSRELV